MFLRWIPASKPAGIAASNGERIYAHTYLPRWKKLKKTKVSVASGFATVGAGIVND